MSENPFTAKAKDSNPFTSKAKGKTDVKPDNPFTAKAKGPNPWTAKLVDPLAKEREELAGHLETAHREYNEALEAAVKKKFGQDKHDINRLFDVADRKMATLLNYINRRNVLNNNGRRHL